MYLVTMYQVVNFIYESGSLLKKGSRYWNQILQIINTGVCLWKECEIALDLGFNERTAKIY